MNTHHEIKKRDGGIFGTNFVLYNILLPLVLLAAICLDVCVFSFLYLILLLVHPFAVKGSKNDHPRSFLLLLLLCSLIFAILNVAYNLGPIYYPVLRPYVAECRKYDRLFIQLGLSRANWRRLSFLFYIGKKAVVPLFTLILLIRIAVLRCIESRKYHYGHSSDLTEVKIVEPSTRHSSVSVPSINWMRTMCDGSFTALLAIAAFVYPSLVSALYFLLYFYIFLRWALNKPLSTQAWRILRVFTLLFVSLNICAVYAFQFPIVQRFLKPESLLSRLLGLNKIIKMHCDTFLYPPVTQYWGWPELAHPFVLLALYTATAYQMRIRFTKNLEDRGDGSEASDMQMHPESRTSIQKVTIMVTKAEEKEDEPEEAHDQLPRLSLRRASEFVTREILGKGLRKNLPEMVIDFVKSQSYVLTLFVMMAWSLTYHSWLTFVMLMTSCVVWMYPNSQQFCMKISPLIAVYSTMLLILQFIYSLNLTQKELPDETPAYLRQFGMEKPRERAPFADLCIKAIFTSMIYLTVKQRTATRKYTYEATLEEKQALQAEPDKEAKKGFGSQLKEYIADYWVVVNLCLLLAISLQDPVVLYRLLYMTFFQIFVNMFQISFPTWRKLLYTFWMIMVVYCMVVLTLIYTYQFHGVPEFYHRYLSEDVVKSIGLERISSSRLLIRLLTPISFLIFTLVQVNFFHERLMKRTGQWEEILFAKKSELSRIFAELHKTATMRMDFFRQHFAMMQTMMRPQELKVREEEEDLHGQKMKVKMKVYLGKIERKCQNLVSKRSKIGDFFWRIVEIHMDKAIAALMIHIAVTEVAASNLPYVIFVAFVLPREHLFNPLCGILSVWTSVLIISKMVYQMDAFKEEVFHVECENPHMNGTYNTLEWVGVKKTEVVAGYLQPYICLSISFALRTVVMLRQSLHRQEKKEAPPLRGIVFPHVNRKKADQNMTKCLKYLVNYFFYKFGLEICLICSVINIGIRCDFLAVFYCIVMITVVCMERTQVARIWPCLTTSLAILLSVQYFLCLGLPKMFCSAYPWSSWDHNMIEWLFLPDHLVPPNPIKLWADFLQFLVVSCQAYVFAIETSKDAEYYPGGLNTPVVSYQSLSTILIAEYKREKLDRRKLRRTPVKVPDYISSCQDLLDHAKNFVFLYFYWITLGVIFAAGTGTVTLFAMGYVIGCFLFLWVGNSLFLKPMAIALQLWDTLVLYNVVVIFIKISLQVVGCVYMSQMYKNFCWVLQLFGIACLKTGMDPEQIVGREILGECNVPHKEAGIFYDGLCFAFLLVQRRIFLSEYFKHVIAEYRSQRFFASRGAQLIAKITIKEIKEAEERENEILAKVKRKMDKIKSKHTKERRDYLAATGKQMDLITPDDFIVTPSSMGGTVTTFPVYNREASRDTSPIIFSDNGNISPMSNMSSNQYHWAEEIPSGPLLSPSIPRKRGLPLKPQATPILEQTEGEGSEDEWYSPTTEKIFDPKIVEGEGGVRGLGPLQLLNFAFKKGAIREALKESNDIQATHQKLEKEMEETFGVADHQAIRRAIFKQKSRKPKADYDEDTFNEMAMTHREQLPAILARELRRRSTIPSLLTVDGKKLAELSRKSLGEVGRQETLLSQDSSARRSSGSSSPVKESIDTMAFCHMMALEEERSETSGEEAEEQEIERKKALRLRMRESKFFEYYISIREFLRNLWTFVCLFSTGVVESLISNLMLMSRDHRYVVHILTNEKKLHKELADDSDDETMTASFRERKRNMLKNKIENQKFASSLDIDEDMQKLHEAIEAEYRNEQLALIGHEETEQAGDDSDMSSLKKESSTQEYLLIRLIKAIFFLIISRSEILCYIMIVLNHMSSASLLSMPLPLMTFLWGTLTVPRPTKRFWITIITYTEVIVIVKTLFQFGFFPWNTSTSVDPLWIPRLLGIEKRNKYAAWDLALLMTLFFHRSILMANGLWISEMDEEILRRRCEKKRLKQELSASRKVSIATIAEMRSTADLRQFADLGRQKIQHKVSKRMGALRAFFNVLQNPAGRSFPVDMYAPMFICDVICFLIIIFGYSDFGTDAGGGDVTAYFSENKVPGTLVMMLIMQFVLIIFDRALFLRKYLIGKIVFQIGLVIFVHIWMFMLLPAATDRLFINNSTCKLWYFTKVVYFIISAKQIRAGYPKRSLGNIITNSFTAINWVLYKAFMMIPFLFELRCLMDWIWMDTALAVGDWFMFNDIFSHVSMLKCERNIDEDYPSPKGVKKRAILKYGLGGFLLVCIILVIWFPLVLFSMANTVGIRSLPIECTVQLTISGFQPLYESTAQLGNIRGLSYEEYVQLQYPYRLSKGAQSYMTEYTHEDVVKAEINGNSSTRWMISPPSRHEMIRQLESQPKIDFKFSWLFKRAPDENLQFGTVEDFKIITINSTNPIRQTMVSMLNGDFSQEIRLEHLFPPLLKVPGDGKSDAVGALLWEHLKKPTDPIQTSYVDIILALNKEGRDEWWTVRMVDPRFDPIKDHDEVILNGLLIYGFVDKVFPVTFSFITGGGILGLYFSLVLVFGKLMRDMVTGAMVRIMFDELPNVDRVLQLCLDILLVREAGEMELEEDLFAKLVFLFRSPATLIKWTKDKTE